MPTIPTLRPSPRTFLPAVIIALLAALTLAGCSLLGRSEPERYTFRTLSDPSLAAGTGKLLIREMTERMLQAGQQATFGTYMARFRGSALALFGPPLTTSTDAESAFEYVVEASDGQGTTWILTVYHGPSGPAIGGDSRDTTIEPVARALLRRIEQTPPADFTATIYDSDTDHTITYGCQQGSCSWSERPGK